MQKITTVIFDWDGTLAKTLHLWLAGYRSGLKEQQHTFPDTIIVRDFFYEHDEGQKKYPSINFTQLFEATRDYVQTNLSTLELYERATETLQKLQSAGIHVTLVSSSPRKLLEAGLEVHELTSYFSSIIAGDDVTKRKPNPESFLQTLELVQANPTTTLIIGDAASDIIAGKAANTQTCLFTPEDNTLFYDFAELQTTNPKHQISSLSELLDICL